MEEMMPEHGVEVDRSKIYRRAQKFAPQKAGQAIDFLPTAHRDKQAAQQY